MSLLRDRAGRWLHALIDRRIDERLEAEREAIAARAVERSRWAALREHQLWGPADRLEIAPTAQVNDALFNTVSGRIVVREHAFFGHGVSVLTGTHDVDVVGPQRRHAIPDGGRDVEIGAGAWIASRAMILGPARIGADAVVAAGAVVSGDVPKGAVVAGVPARVVRHISSLGGLPAADDVDTDVGRMYVHAGDEVITPELRAGGYGDQPEIRALRAALRPRMTIVDVGANVGYVTLLAAAAVGPEGLVVSVEPHPANVRLLRANAARHDHGNVRVVEAAAWSRAGELELTECASNTGDHRIGALAAERALRRVPAVRLDELLGDAARLDVIKLDTQATEHVVLEGARELLERFSPLIFAEYWPQGIREHGDDPLAVLRGYRALGYSLEVVEEGLGDGASDERIMRAVDARPAPFGGFATLALRADG